MERYRETSFLSSRKISRCKSNYLSIIELIAMNIKQRKF